MISGISTPRFGDSSQAQTQQNPRRRGVVEKTLARLVQDAQSKGKIAPQGHPRPVNTKMLTSPCATIRLFHTPAHTTDRHCHVTGKAISVAHPETVVVKNIAPKPPLTKGSVNHATFKREHPNEPFTLSSGRTPKGEDPNNLIVTPNTPGVFPALRQLLAGFTPQKSS